MLGGNQDNTDARSDCPIHGASRFTQIQAACPSPLAWTTRAPAGSRHGALSRKPIEPPPDRRTRKFPPGAGRWRPMPRCV